MYEQRLSLFSSPPLQRSCYATIKIAPGITCIHLILFFFLHSKWFHFTVKAVPLQFKVLSRVLSVEEEKGVKGELPLWLKTVQFPALKLYSLKLLSSHQNIFKN